MTVLSAAESTNIASFQVGILREIGMSKMCSSRDLVMVCCTSWFDHHADFTWFVQCPSEDPWTHWLHCSPLAHDGKVSEDTWICVMSLDLCHVLSDTLCGSMTCLEDGHLFATRCDGVIQLTFWCDGYFIAYGYCLSLRYCETFRNKPGRPMADRDERGKLKFMREVFFVVLLLRYNLRDMQLVL